MGAVAAAVLRDDAHDAVVAGQVRGNGTRVLGPPANPAQPFVFRLTCGLMHAGGIVCPEAAASAGIVEDPATSL